MGPRTFTMHIGLLILSGREAVLFDKQGLQKTDSRMVTHSL